MLLQLLSRSHGAGNAPLVSSNRSRARPPWHRCAPRGPGGHTPSGHRPPPHPLPHCAAPLLQGHRVRHKRVTSSSFHFHAPPAAHLPQHLLASSGGLQGTAQLTPVPDLATPHRHRSQSPPAAGRRGTSPSAQLGRGRLSPTQLGRNALTVSTGPLRAERCALGVPEAWLQAVPRGPGATRRAARGRAPAGCPRAEPLASFHQQRRWERPVPDGTRHSSAL